MIESAKKLRLSWSLIRSIVATITFFTFVMITSIISSQLSLLRILALIVGMVVSVIAAANCNLMWARIALIVELALFSVAMITALFSPEISVALPLLLLAFVMVLFSDRTMNLLANHGQQFSVLGEPLLLDFNAPVLQRSLAHLYRRVARNGVIFAGCYLITIGALLGGFDFHRFAPILSDVSLYILAISISLALLVSMKED